MPELGSKRGEERKEMKLTKRAIDAAKFSSASSSSSNNNTPDYRWDDAMPGFGVRIYRSGKKSFVVSYRVQGRKRIMVLGKYGVLTLDEARKKARKVLGKVTDGRDPSRERMDLLKSPTMSDLAKRYLSDHAPKKKASSAKTDERMWELHILPRLGSRKVSAITREDIDRLHTGMKDTPYAANRTLALLSKSLHLAEVWGWRQDSTNPCRHIQKYTEEKRERFLSVEELKRLGAVLDEVEREATELPGVVPALRLLLLTGCRLNEILRLRWEDIDEVNRCFYLPDSKTGKRIVVVSEGVFSVLEKMECVKGNPYVIAGAREGQHLVNLSKPWGRIRKRANLADVRLHDLRHTYASFGAGAGLSLPLIGKMLGHTQASTTARYAHLANDPVRRAVDLVGDELLSALHQK